MLTDRTVSTKQVSRNDASTDLIEKASSWELWRAQPSEPFEIKYDRTVTFFAVEGRAEITFDNGTVLDVQAGDFVTIRPPLKGVWRVIEPIENRYRYHEGEPKL